MAIPLRRLRSVTEERQFGQVTREQILNLPSTPICSPSYPHGPFRFIDREYFIVAYESDAEAVRRFVPEPLKPVGSTVLYEWIRMPDSTGFGDYTESGTVIPCELDGQPINFVSQMFLDCEPPIAAGREVWGFPKKYAKPVFQTNKDTVVGTLEYGGQMAALGTMTYKYAEIPEEEAIKALAKPACNLKVIPGPDMQPSICQLIQYSLTNIKLKGAWKGDARLELMPHINCPTSELPVRKILSGKHFLADITLPYGELVHDYLKDPNDANKLGDGLVRDVISMPITYDLTDRRKIVSTGRKHLVFIYESDYDSVACHIPDRLQLPSTPVMVAQWVSCASGGLGDYEKFDLMTEVYDDQGKRFFFQLQAYSDSSSTIIGGREIYGQPFKYATAQQFVDRDTICGKLTYSGITVASGTMNYKHAKMENALELLQTPLLNLKFIPSYHDEKGGAPAIAQLVSIDKEDIKIESAYSGNGRLHLTGHVNAPIADYPVRRMLNVYNINCDFTLSLGKVEHDYLA